MKIGAFPSILMVLGLALAVDADAGGCSSVSLSRSFQLQQAPWPAVKTLDVIDGEKVATAKIGFYQSESFFIEDEREQTLAEAHPDFLGRLTVKDCQGNRLGTVTAETRLLPGYIHNADGQVAFTFRMVDYFVKQQIEVTDASSRETVAILAKQARLDLRVGWSVQISERADLNPRLAVILGLLQTQVDHKGSW